MPLSHTDDLHRELRELRASWEYAFANAHGCTYGSSDPRLAWVHQRERDLLARIQEFADG